MKIIWQYAWAVCRMFWAPLVVWNSDGPEMCGLHKNGRCYAAWWCHQWVYRQIFSLIVECSFWSIWWWQLALTMSLHNLKSRSTGTLMFFWPSLDGFTTAYIFKLCCNVISTNASTNQLDCSTQVSASVFTKPNVQLCHLHCHSGAMNGFQVCILHKNRYLHKYLYLLTCGLFNNSVSCSDCTALYSRKISV